MKEVYELTKDKSYKRLKVMYKQIYTFYLNQGKVLNCCHCEDKGIIKEIKIGDLYYFNYSYHHAYNTVYCADCARELNIVDD
jgi:hypothetical protein